MPGTNGEQVLFWKSDGDVPAVKGLTGFDTSEVRHSEHLPFFNVVFPRVTGFQIDIWPLAVVTHTRLIFGPTN